MAVLRAWATTSPDGSVKSVKYTVDAANWMRLCLIADGETITADY